MSEYGSTVDTVIISQRLASSSSSPSSYSLFYVGSMYNDIRLLVDR